MKNVFKIGFIFLLISCSKEIELNKTVERNGFVYEVNKTIPYTGIAFSYHENSQIKSKEIYKDGLQSGVSEYFFINGQVKQISNFFEGVMLDGQHTQYFKDGKIAKTWTLLDGDLEGIEEIFYENGQLKTRKNYISGELDGLYEEYNEDGSLSTTQILKNGNTLDVKYYSYHDNGRVSSINRYWSDKNFGVLNNRFEEFFENGVKEYSCDYKNRKRDGVCETFFDNGLLKTTTNYYEGEINGNYEEYREDGNLIKKSKFEDGKEVYSEEFLLDMQSPYKLLKKTIYIQGSKKMVENFYANGNTKEEINFNSLGNKDGDYEYFFKDGQTKIKQVYENGILEGQFFEYYSNGQLAAEGRYKNGKVLMDINSKYFYENGEPMTDICYVGLVDC